MIMHRISKILCTLALSLSMMLSAAAAFAQSSGEEYFLQGNTLYNQKKYAEAVASYTHAIQTQPHSLPKAYLNCARAYTMQKNYGAAEVYYKYYGEVSPDADKDRKYKAEYKEAQKRARNANYRRDDSQTRILSQLKKTISAGGPFLDRQNNGAFQYYDILLRSGFAEPELYALQRQLVNGLTSEIETDITPASGQPLPDLDRTGWVFIRNKIAKGRQFADVSANNARLDAIEATALAWENLLRENTDEAEKYFASACTVQPAIPAAHWGRLMLKFQRDDKDILKVIDETQEVYKAAGIKQMDMHFAILRAQAYRNLGDIDKSMNCLQNISGQTP